MFPNILLRSDVVFADYIPDPWGGKPDLTEPKSAGVKSKRPRGATGGPGGENDITVSRSSWIPEFCPCLYSYFVADVKTCSIAYIDVIITAIEVER